MITGVGEAFPFIRVHALLDAMQHAEYEPGYSYDAVVRDFTEGNRGVVSFTYNDIRETLS